jgi:hypothetical protein
VDSAVIETDQPPSPGGRGVSAAGLGVSLRVEAALGRRDSGPKPMAVLFLGFPRVLARQALRPGRWFQANMGKHPLLGLVTDVGEGEDALVVAFQPARVDQLDFSSPRLREISGATATIEDDLVFSPGEALEKPHLMAPTKRSFFAGSLVRLKNGDLGVGFAAGEGGKELMLVSLNSGMRCEGFDLVFERWSLSLQRGEAAEMVGRFRPHV